MTTTKVQSELIAVNAISGTIIADGAITSTHLAANCVDSSELVTGSIDTIHIAANQVTATKIVTNGVLTRHISDDQVTADKLANSINTDIATGPAALPKAGGTMTGTIAGFTSTGIDDNANATAITIDSSENVGIGTSNPGNRLHIEGPASAHTALQIETITSGFDPTIHFVSAHNSAGMYLDGTTDNKINFYNGNGKGTAGKEITFDNNGNVGIGTNNPTVKLDIYNSSGWGGLDIDGTSGGEIRIQKAGTRYGGIYANDSTGLVILAENGVDSTLFYTGGSLRMTIASNGDVSFNGGVVKGARQTINHQGTTNAITVSGNTYNTTITSVNVTTTGNSKLMVWAHSGQILKSFDNANPQMNIQVAGTQIGSAHDGNHYWYATAGANSTSARVFLTQFGVSGTLAAGTHTVSLIAGAYGANHTFNYQNQNCHMVIMEVGA